MRDFVTVARTGAGYLATKTHEHRDGAWHTENFDAGYLFQSRQVEVDGLGQMFGLLHRLGPVDDLFILRGRVRDGIDGDTPHVRRYHPKDPTPEDRQPAPPSYEPVDHHWLCVDVDSFDLPEDLRTPEMRSRAVRLVVDGLPDWLARAGYIAQWSSSAGLDGFAKAKLHLWFWSDRAVCGFSLREHFRAWDGDTRIDCALYNPVQPHYTATPRFTDGTPDPLLRTSYAPTLAGGDAVGTVNDRLMLTYGDPASPPRDVLCLADWEHLEEVLREAQARRRALARAEREALGTAWGTKVGTMRYVKGAMRNAMANVANLEGHDDWYIVLRGEIYSTCTLVAAGDLDEVEWRSAWEEVAMRPGALPGRAMSYADTKRLIDGARAKVQPRDMSHVGSGGTTIRKRKVKGSFKERASAWMESKKQ